MTKIKFQSRPFDLAHAKAGAKVCCRDGGELEILKWDRKHSFCIIGIAVQDAALRRWRADGSYSEHANDNFDLVMPPLGYTDDGKPVWTGDMIISPGKTALRGAEPMQRIFSGYTWPVAAKAVEDAKRADAALCKTENLLEALGWRLMDGEWYNAYASYFYGETNGINVTGRKEDIQAVIALCAMRDARPARELAIAQAVLAVVLNARFTIPGEDGIDLAAVIASMKP